MTVATVNAFVHVPRADAAQRPGLSRSAALDGLSVGRIVNVHVLRRFDTHRYLVAIDGHAHHVDSAALLAVGSKGRATVVAVGEKVELRLEELQQPGRLEQRADGEAAQEPTGEPAASANRIVTDLAERYRVALDEADRARLVAVAATSANPEAMARGGLFLTRLGVPIDARSVDALYVAQAGACREGPSRSGSPIDLSALASAVLGGDPAALESLRQLLMDVLDEGSPGAPGIVLQMDGDASGASSGIDLSSGELGSDAGRHDANPRGDSRGERNSQDGLARWLLNLQDGGALAHRYGSLPVLVGGQLVELDLVLFHQRRGHGEAHQPLRRLVMTLRTESLGAVQVMAEALDNRLMISVSGRSASDAGALAEHSEEVRRLVERLGWNVDSVGYSFDPWQGRAAVNVVRHVLETGSIDRVL